MDYNQPFDDLLNRLVPARVHHSLQTAGPDGKQNARQEILAGASESSIAVTKGQGCPPSTLVVLGRWLSNSSSSLERALRAYRKLDLSQVTAHVARPVVKRAKWLNATELAQLVERYQAGATTYDLAEEFSIGRETVAHRLKAEGIKLRRNKLTETDLARAIELYASGLSTIKIGVILGRRHSTVWYALKTAGVQLRDAHER